MTGIPKFSVGDRVRLAGDASRLGVVIAPVQSLGSNDYYQVLFPGEEHPVFHQEDELEIVSTDRSSPAAWLLDQPPADASPFAEYFTLLKLRTRLSDHLYSYLSSRTIFRVYQFKPVLKLLNSPYQRLLIADEVGLGKTIEAGLIWAELDSRMSLDRVLVVCPSGLRRKWQIELERRFDREVPVIDSTAGLDELLERYGRKGDGSRFASVAGLESLRSRQNLEKLREVNPTFDLVVVDEAHHMRNTGTLSYQLGEFLSESADYLLFLTATPLNLGTPDLYNLVNLLVPEEFDSVEVFNDIIGPNEHVNAALRALRASFPPNREEVVSRLRRVEGTTQARRFVKSPIYREVLDELNASIDPSRRRVVELQRKITELNTLSLIYTRTRKRDLAERFAVREAVTIPVEWSDAEWRVYEAVTAYVATRYRRIAASGAPLGFVAIMPQRQAASCLPVMRDYLIQVLEQRMISADFQEGEEEFDDASASLADPELASLEDALSAAQALRQQDSKYDAFAEELRHIRTGEPGSRVMVFSFFRRTLSYLEERLRGEGFLVERMDGSTNRETRERLMDEFREGSFQILLSSEIGAEGLDFEFCRFLFNYDLPWNPMRLEQRIGRLDRFGQLNERILIVNFQIPGTIETDIFERLYERIGIFVASIGELEPILGEAMRELERSLLSPELTPIQQRAEVDRIAAAIEGRRAELEEFEENRARFVGQDDYVVEQLDEIERQRRYITPEEIERLFRGFLTREVGGRTSLTPDGDDSHLLYLQASPHLAELLRPHLQSEGGPALDLLTQVEAGTGLTVTFDPDVAYRRRVEFLNLRHPLIKGLMSYYDEQGRVYRAGRIRFPGPRAGNFLFFVFLLESSGLLPRHNLVAVAVDMATAGVDEATSDLVLPALAQTVLNDPDRMPVLQPDLVTRCYAGAQAFAFAERERLKAELERTNVAIVSSRQESLIQSLDRRSGRIKQLMMEAREPRIRRMRESQVRNLEGRVRTKIAELERQKIVNVSLRPLAGGFAQVF